MEAIRATSWWLNLHAVVATSVATRATEAELPWPPWMRTPCHQAFQEDLYIKRQVHFMRQ